MDWDDGTTAFILSDYHVEWEWVDTIETCNGPAPDGLVFLGCAHQHATGYTIRVISGMPESQAMRTMYHEIGHVVLWSVGRRDNHHNFIRPLGL